MHRAYRFLFLSSSARTLAVFSVFLYTHPVAAQEEATPSVLARSHQLASQRPDAPVTAVLNAARAVDLEDTTETRRHLLHSYWQLRGRPVGIGVSRGRRPELPVSGGPIRFTDQNRRHLAAALEFDLGESFSGSNR